jgi:hypothetical protein
MAEVLHANRIADLNLALVQDLPFQIPSTDMQLVQQFPKYFEYRSSNIDCYVSSFLQYCTIGESESTTSILDGDWLRMMDKCLLMVKITLNQYDRSSVQLKRPDATVQVHGAVTLKQEAKYKSEDLEIAFHELTEKLHADAFKVFPQGCNSIIGVASCVGRIQLAIITYDPTTRHYSARVWKEYKVRDLSERVSFLVDLMKVCRWMSSVTGSNANFHLIPNLRRSTDNHHHITWTAEGIYKEFDHNRDMGQAMQHIHEVYTHTPRLIYVEHGRVIDDKSIIITRIGNKLSLVNMNCANLTKEMVVSQVRRGLNELHDIGLAHCDLMVSNVFIDSNGVVFLGDLEYLTPVNDPAPNFNRLPAGISAEQVRSAGHLDELQFQVFTAEVTRM